jgi:hypothetical protein
LEVLQRWRNLLRKGERGKKNGMGSLKILRKINVVVRRGRGRGRGKRKRWRDLKSEKRKEDDTKLKKLNQSFHQLSCMKKRIRKSLCRSIRRRKENENLPRNRQLNVLSTWKSMKVNRILT